MPSLKLLIAVSLRVFTVMNLGGVVLVCEIQMLENKVDDLICY